MLLALARGDLHGYAIKNVVLNDSLGGVDISTGRLYQLLNKLHDEGLIEFVELRATNRSGIKRVHYGLSEMGTIRLQEELKRWEQAVKIGRANQLMNNPVPTDIQRLQLAIDAKAKTRHT